jgi:deoxycytidine triphosphate deaminase
MSLLTDTDLERIIARELKGASENALVIYPYSEDSLTPVGYDLRVGSPVATSNEVGRKKLVEGECFSIASGATALISTLESLRMPLDRSISGLIESKVTKVSKGLSHISTTVDPDWEGHLLIAVHNHSSEKFTLTYGETFCTMVFLKNSSPSTRPCNKDPGRLDVFLEKFDKETSAAARKRAMKEYFPPLTIIIISCIGWYLFDNTPGFIASVAFSVAISQFIAAKIR